jgi:hypothetical protein
MSVHAANDTTKKQQRRFIPSSFKKAFINAVHLGANTVDVYFVENPQTIIRNIPVANTVTLAANLVGRRCRIDIFDETNPSDMAMAYTF